MKRVWFLISCFVFAFTSCVFSVQLEQGRYGLKVIKDNFEYAKSEWVAFDSDGDGMEEYHYFDPNGFMLVDTTIPDGSQVNDKGQWVIDGVVQKKTSEVGSSGVVETSGAVSNILVQPTTPKEEAVFEAKNENTEGVENDPNTIPPKAKEAIEWIRFWCMSDSEIVLPWSKRWIKDSLKLRGYKTDIINRAIAECKVNWNEHAAIRARDIKKRHNGYDKKDIKELLKGYYDFNNSEVNYALSHLYEESKTGKYINPSDFTGLTDEECKVKLSTYGLTEEQIKQALTFIKNKE